MLNSFTNFLHALALFTYAVLVYLGLQAENTHFSLVILLLFILLFALKVLGVLVHLPSIERDPHVRNPLWASISFGVVILNAATLYVLSVPLVMFALSMVVTFILVGVFLYTLRTHVRYAPIAFTFIFVPCVAAFFTCGLLQIGYLLIVASNVLWIALSRIPFLFRNAYHNDVYHLALIVSTYVLFRAFELGVWKTGCVGVEALF